MQQKCQNDKVHLFRHFVVRVGRILRLALLAEKKTIRHSALKNGQKVDPQNSVWYYLLAVEQAEADLLDEALVLVQEGNRRDKCAKYQVPCPADVTIVYPATQPFDECSVAGRQVPEGIVRRENL